jgi:hypothetical protein
MAYLNKYIGIYRVKTHIDKSTNDFPRVVKNNEKVLDPSNDDLFIVCKNNIQIYHYGKGVLVGYIPSIKRGHNIIKQIYIDTIGNIDESDNDYKRIYECLSNKGLVYDFEETDREVLFKFKGKNMSILEKYLEPSTYGAKTRPFSTDNLPKRKLNIPEDDMKLFDEIVSCIPKEKDRDDKQGIMMKMQMYRNLNQGFINSLTTKNYTTKDITSDMKLVGLKGKEYFYYKGLWSKYLQSLKEQLEEKYNDK